VGVATILIYEADPAVAELMAVVVRRLGHVPVDLRDTAHLPEADVLVLEPGDEGAEGWAKLLRTLFPGLPVVCVSIYPRPEASALEPVAYLMKPFPLAALEAAIARALASRAAG
jgi:hypothetical protein